MFCEFYTGSESFPGGARTLQFSTLVYNPVSARFENPRQLTAPPDGGTPVCRSCKILMGIPASHTYTETKDRMWYQYRGECRHGSLWMFESRLRVPGSTFGYEIERLLLRLVENAVPLRATYTPPKHADANMHKLELTLNALRVRSANDLLPDERGAFKKFTGDVSDSSIEDSQNPDMLPRWDFALLEPKQKLRRPTAGVEGRLTPTTRIRRIRR